MKISVEVTPLCGAYEENPHPLSYVVSVDGFNLLMDCGWNDQFNPSLLQPLSRVASTIDSVLLSHPDMLHLGALPYAKKHFGLSAPVYATTPVFELGRLTMYDHYFSRKQQVSEFDLFTPNDIETAFDNGTSLTYKQEFHLPGKGKGIVIVPHLAGHLLGGTVWEITKGGEDIVYAVDFNHCQERHVYGTVLDSFVGPDVLIADASNALSKQLLSTDQRDQRLLEVILNTLRTNGSVLLPVDPAGRVLELLLILEQYWEEHGLTYPIFFLSHLSSTPCKYLTNVIEWMGDSIAKSIDNSRWDDDFLLKHLIYKINTSRLEKLSEGPKIVLASMASLEVGYSHDIFEEWAADARNLVLFTERGQFGTRARMLQDLMLIGGQTKVGVTEDMGSMHVGRDLAGKLATLMLDTTPSKVISSEFTAKPKCKLVYMDFEGRSDGQSIKSILARVAPSKLVLVHGSAEATEHLKQYCLIHVCDNIYTPQIEETLTLSASIPNPESIFNEEEALNDLKQIVISKFLLYLNNASNDGLKKIKGINKMKASSILAHRPFESLHDFMEKMGYSVREANNMVAMGVGRMFK